MSGENWTPGPWVKDSSVCRYAINDAASNSRHVAMVSGFELRAGDREENEANARLIAAAPELYEALKTACVNALELGHCAGYDCPNCSAGRALKKARGES